ncbi:MAG: hypothetical protein OER56_04175, partial [Hyphomicrobiales bacterium]|nr:hypothetical protein [Hyphomicrobiales bacterium]
ALWTTFRNTQVVYFYSGQLVEFCSGVDRAHLSHRDPESADLVVRREDVDNGFRWSIERSSLERKIEQELEFEARRVKNDDEPLHTGADASQQVRTSAVMENGDVRNENPSEPVHTGSHPSEPVHSRLDIVEQLESRVEDLKSEVEFYRDELRDRRQTTTALTDVIEAFRLSAASNASRAGERAERKAHDVRPIHDGDKWREEGREGEV